MSEHSPHQTNGLVAYVIGMDGEYRGGALEQQLARQVMECSRVNALDARRLDETELEFLVDQEAAQFLQHRPLSPGEVGCAWSHRAAWREIAASGAPWGAVFEDDARLCYDFGELSEILDAIPTDEPALLLLGYQKKYAVARTRNLRMVTRSGRRVYCAATPAPGAYAYIMNGPAARLAHHRSERRVSAVADWPASWAYDTKFYFVAPELAIVDEEVDSTLHAVRGDLERQSETRLRRFLRHAESVTLLRYMRGRRHYPGLAQFWAHEVIRPSLLTLARKRGKALTDGFEGPWAL